MDFFIFIHNNWILICFSLKRKVAGIFDCTPILHWVGNLSLFLSFLRFKPGTCLNIERKLFNFNTKYKTCVAHVACYKGIHHEFDGFCLPPVAVESVHADWVRAYATFARFVSRMWRGLFTVYRGLYALIISKVLNLNNCHFQMPRSKRKYFFKNL